MASPWTADTSGGMSVTKADYLSQQKNNISLHTHFPSSSHQSLIWMKWSTAVVTSPTSVTLFTRSEKWPHTYTHFADGGLLEEELKVAHFPGGWRRVRGGDHVRSRRHELQHISKLVRSDREHCMVHISSSGCKERRIFSSLCSGCYKFQFSVLCSCKCSLALPWKSGFHLCLTLGWLCCEQDYT